jgi:GR25 family glycosyltransferase involved in LPS biosynthesis
MLECYIITIQGNDISETFSKKCQESCEKVGMPSHIWKAIDGTDNGIRFQIPEENFWLNWISNYSTEMTITEIACALSHISLWGHCLNLDKPIVILEHDALMKKPIEEIPFQNLFLSLHKKQNSLVQRWLPPNSEYKKQFCISGLHAYCIDPLMAKKLLAHFIVNGLEYPIDVSINTNQFSISYIGEYAELQPQTMTTVRKFWNN